MRQDNTPPFDGRPLQREALAWVARLASGEATRADAADLASWRARGPAHEDAFRQAARLWNRLGPAMETPVAHPPTVAIGSGAVHRLSRRAFLRAGALAASVAGIGLAGRQAGLWPSVSEALADHRTATGERRRVELADGSVVELNTRSSLSVRFTPTERRIELHGGEAAFTVVRDPARPFVVAAAGGTTVAVGTVFSVRAKDGAVAVSCLEGKVEVSRHGSARLGAGERVAYDGRGMGATSPDDGVSAAAWRKGVLVFRDDALDGVVAEINRYRPGLVVVADRAQGARRISGIFHLDRLDEAIAHLRGTLNLRAFDLPGGLLVLR